ncbi:lysosomal protective protein-like [Glandiceps talaboti]
MANIGTLLSLVLFAGSLGILCADNPDEIKSLPGLKQQPTFKQYSGFLNATGTRKLHYWFVESQGNPSKDPLLLWVNGGPGCSSLDGFLSELGPFHVNDDGTTLYENEFSWNKVANVLILEAPAGVGFSYSDDKNYTTSDDQVSLDNYAALQSFFVKFPEFVNNSFYVTGESYGGIYVPTLSVRIMKGNATINFKGLAVGNGYVSAELNDNSIVYFAYYHGLFGDDLWTNLNDYCCNQGICNFHNNTDQNCQIGLNQVNHIIFDIGLNEYALYLDCDGGIPPHLHRFRTAFRNMFRFYHFQAPKWNPNKKIKTLKNRLHGVIDCVNTTAETNYLNMDSVRKALHIPETVQTWQVCSDEVSENYQRNYDTMYDQFQSLLSSEMYRVLVYNGDTDMACNFLGDQWFVESLNRKEVQTRQPWIYSDQVAGFYHQFQNITFVTVKGSGHMVPQWRPGQALQMITDFLNGKM